MLKWLQDLFKSQERRDPLDYCSGCSVFLTPDNKGGYGSSYGSCPTPLCKECSALDYKYNQRTKLAYNALKELNLSITENRELQIVSKHLKDSIDLALENNYELTLLEIDFAPRDSLFFKRLTSGVIKIKEQLKISIDSGFKLIRTVRSKRRLREWKLRK